MNLAILSMILAVAVEVGVPPYFALAIALEENDTLNPLAVHENADGTADRGVMQLNSSWYDGEWQDPETNIRAGCLLIKELYGKGLNWWQVAVAYNCGYARLASPQGPPGVSIDYACRVFTRWEDLENERKEIILMRWFEYQKEIEKWF
jgi:soluble lytic murein transglycosylase-like protein